MSAIRHCFVILVVWYPQRNYDREHGVLTRRSVSIITCGLGRMYRFFRP